jgi:hypothetical protein
LQQMAIILNFRSVGLMFVLHNFVQRCATGDRFLVL